MAIPVSNVDIAVDTFASLVTIVNQSASIISNNAVTVDSTTGGTIATGNGAVNGIFSATTIRVADVYGGNGTSAANVQTLTLGFVNSSISSNVVVTGLAANITSNTLTITSNTTVDASLINVTGRTIFEGNTTVKSNSSYTTAVLKNDNTSANINFTANTFDVTADEIVFDGSISLFGNTNIGGNSTVINIITTANTTEYTLALNGNTTVNGDLTLTGSHHAIEGNAVFNGNLVFIDSLNGYVGIGLGTSGAPHHKLDILSETTNEILLHLENTADNVNAHFRTEASNNDIRFELGTDSGFRLVVDSNHEAFYASSNGNIGLHTATPNVELDVYGQGHISGNVVFDQNIVVTGNVTGDAVYLNTTGAITVDSSSYTYTTTTAQEIDSFNITDYQSAKYTIQVQNIDLSDEVTMTEISMVVGYGNVHTTEYGTIHSNAAFVSFTSEANSTHAILKMATLDVNFANSIAVRIMRTSLS